MRIFEHQNYKEFVRAWIETQPNQGRGLYQKISERLKMHRTTVSQVFRGEKDLTYEQASELCEFLGLSHPETMYFLTLVQLERAGTTGLQKTLKQALQEMKKASIQTTLRAEKSIEISDSQKSQFYSDWIYSAIRVVCSIPGCQTADAIAKRLDLNLETTNRAIAFLREAGLIQITQDGKVEPGPKTSYLPPESPFINSHRKNWRLKAISQFQSLRSDDLAFSAPISMSEALFRKLQKKLRTIIEDLYREVEEDSPQTPMIFNIDCLRF